MKPLFLPSRLGEILQEANLVSRPQIELALRDQFIYDNLRLGEILALRGWIKKETADFFAEQWYHLIINEKKYPLGYYLKSAALLDEAQIQAILKEQSQIGLRFGTVAVLQGWLNEKTLEFFLKYLVSENNNKSTFIEKQTLPQTPKKQNSFEEEKDPQIFFLDTINSIKTNEKLIEAELKDFTWIN